MKEAEYIQFSWFSNEFVNQDIEQIYRDLVGTDADTSQKNKDVSPVQPFLSQANGNSDGLNYLVRYDHQRFDFVVKKSNDGTPPIGPLIDVNSNLSNLVEKVSSYELCQKNTISRLALIINLCSISKNINEINKLFLELCPLKIPSNSTTDLFFRFNRKKKLENICEINRHISYITNYIIGIVENMNNNSENENKYYLLNVQVDFNTVPNQILENEIHKDVWSGFANEISEFLKNPSVENME